MGRYFEEINVGDKFISQGKTITDTHITLIASLAGFVIPLFNDEEFARKTVFGGRIAPGRLTLLVMGGLSEQTEVFGDKVIALLGLNNVKIKKPLKAGDTIHVELLIIEKRETSDPTRGVIIHKESCLNQKDEVVAEAEVAHLMRRKPRTQP